jgi:pteridine reductase
VAKEALSGKVCLITGGAKRVGAAIARRLHGAGANLMLHYHSAKAESVELQQALNAARANSAATVQANLLNAAELPELVRTTMTRFGRLDILVNNASTFYATPLGEIKLTEWDDLVGASNALLPRAGPRRT